MPAQCGGLAEDTASTLPGAESAGERESTEVEYTQSCQVVTTVHT